jgi:hypothetical protein
VPTNQQPGTEQGQALASVRYDLRKDLGLSAALGPKQAEKTQVVETQLAVTRRGDGLVCDRAYADDSVRAMLLAWQGHCVSRFPRQSFTAGNAVWTSSAQECVVTRAVPASARAYGREQQLATTLRVRLLKVRLPSGEGEGLGTNLLDARRYPAAGFKAG